MTLPRLYPGPADPAIEAMLVDLRSRGFLRSVRRFLDFQPSVQSRLALLVPVRHFYGALFLAGVISDAAKPYLHSDLGVSVDLGVFLACTSLGQFANSALPRYKELSTRSPDYDIVAYAQAAFTCYDFDTGASLVNNYRDQLSVETSQALMGYGLAYKGSHAEALKLLSPLYSHLPPNYKLTTLYSELSEMAGAGMQEINAKALQLPQDAMQVLRLTSFIHKQTHGTAGLIFPTMMWRMAQVVIGTRLLARSLKEPPN